MSGISETLGRAVIELDVEDRKFQQRIRHQSQRVAASARGIEAALLASNARIQTERNRASSSAIRNQTDMARAINSIQVAEQRSRAAAIVRGVRAQQESDRAAIHGRVLANRMRASEQRSAIATMRIREFAQSATTRATARGVANRQRLAFEEARNGQRAAIMRLGHQQQMQENRARNPRNVGGGMGSAFAGGAIGGAAGAFAGGMIRDAVSGLADMAGAGFRFNSQMEDSQLSFAAMLQSEGKAVALLAKLKTMSDVTPFEFADMTRAAGMMLSTNKFSDKQIPDIVEKLSDAAAGSTKGLGALPNISLAMSQIVSKIESGKISAQDMNQLIEAGVHPWQALAKAVGVSESQVRQMAQTGGLEMKHVSGMIDELGAKYKGLAKQKGEKTLSGLTSTLKDKISSTLGSISLPLFDETKTQAKRLIAYLNSTDFSAWAKDMATGVRSAIGWVKDLANNPIAQAIAKFALLAGGVAAVAGAIAGIGTVASIALSSAPAIALIGAVSTLAVAVKKAFDGPEGAKFRETVGEIARKVGEIASNFAGKLLPAAVEFADKWASALGGSERMSSAIGGILDTLNEFTDWLSLASSDWQLLWDDVSLQAREMWESLVDWMIGKVKGIGPAIADAIKSGWDFLKEDAKGSKAADSGASDTGIMSWAKGMADPANINPIQASVNSTRWAIDKLADNPTIGKYVNASIEGMKAGLNDTGLTAEAVARSVSSWGDMRDAFNWSLREAQDQENKVAEGQKRLDAANGVAAKPADKENEQQRERRERREGIDARKEDARRRRQATRDLGTLGAMGSGLADTGRSLWDSVSGIVGAAAGGVADAADKFNPLGGPVDAKKAAKPFQNDFLGFGDLNRQIQQSLGKQSEKEAAKKASEAAKKTEKNTSDAAKAAQAIVDPIRDMARGIRDAIGMGS